MSESDVRNSWLRRQREDTVRAIENKSPDDVLLSMAARYSSLSPQQRIVVDEVLIDQLGSEEEADRFLALSLVADFKITSALPALRRLADWLEAQHDPGAPYEWAKVNRLIALLASNR